MMLTPKEYAFDLVVLFQDKVNGIRKELAKKQALKAVDVVIKSFGTSIDDNMFYTIQYYQEVKQEIEQL
jgi:L-rhamnose isomerase